MSKDEPVDDISKVVDNLFKQGETWWRDWLRNNYGVAVALTDFIFTYGSEYARRQTRLWLGQEYRRSNENP